MSGKQANQLTLYFPTKFLSFLEGRENKSKTIQDALYKCHKKEIDDIEKTNKRD